jgi:hypothetical protein
VHTQNAFSATLLVQRRLRGTGWKSEDYEKREQPSRAVEMRTELARKIAGHAPKAGDYATAISALTLYRRTAPTACNPATYEPSLTVLVQGRKRINLGGTSCVCDESSFVLTSVDVPVVSQILRASKQEPLLSLRLALDMSVVRGTLSQQESPEPVVSSQTHGIAIGKTTDELLSACTRLMDLLDNPEDIPFFSNMIQREIVYRLLQCPQGHRLRAIATLGDQSNRTAKAIGWAESEFQ